VVFPVNGNGTVRLLVRTLAGTARDAVVLDDDSGAAPLIMSDLHEKHVGPRLARRASGP
jgi:hypothetical protein